MATEKINYDAIVRSYGCDNCKHYTDGMASDYCEKCSPDGSPPSKYRPARGTIQEKIWYERADKITYAEYLRFIKTGR